MGAALVTMADSAQASLRKRDAARRDEVEGNELALAHAAR
jgi:hypothetical protein